jgi:predicted dehydrogenase
MIHDIDLVLALAHGEVSDVQAVGVSVVSGSEDIANARVTFSNGTVANLTASRITPKAMRKMRLFQRDAYISADFLNRSVEIYLLKGKGSTEEGEDSPLGPLAQTALLSKGRSVVCQRPRLEKEDALALELSAFLNSIRKGEMPAVSGREGRQALDLALKVMSRIQEHAHWIQEFHLP